VNVRKYCIICAPLTSIIILLYLANYSFAEPHGGAIKSYKEAWHHIEEGEIDKARSLLNSNLKNSKGDYSAFWLVVKSAIYLHGKEYDNSLRTIDLFKEQLKDKYYQLKADAVPEVGLRNKLLFWNYKKTLIISSVSNYYLANWTAALSDFIERTKEFNDNEHYLKAVCFYNLKNYHEALINFQYAYKNSNSEGIKIETAYNIAAIFAVLDDADNAIPWLSIPLEEDQEFWTNKMKMDNDFNSIRNDSNFKKFLKTWED
jgi:tetratricopeptide (TPR) repeat protein